MRENAGAPSRASSSPPAQDGLGVTRVDVTVVGSGPAGAIAAYELASRGRHVLLVDKARFPRYKTCGGGLVGRAVELLPIDVTSVAEHECHRADVHFVDLDRTFSCWRPTPIITMTMRDRLDAALADAARRVGAVFRAPCAVRRLRLGEDTVELATEQGRVQSAFVIGADGATGIVARKAGWARRRVGVPALEAELAVPSDLLHRFSGTARFDFGVVPGGYAWVFPKRHHLSVGVLTTRRREVVLHQLLDTYCERLGLPRAHTDERHGYAIPLIPAGGSFMRGRVMLVGDAAGLADPVTAEGISFAAMSGRLAAEALLADDWTPAVVQRRYHDTLRRLVLPELRIARLFAQLLYGRNPIGRKLIARMGDEVAERLTDIFLGRTTYQGALGSARFLKPLLAAHAIGPAWVRPSRPLVWSPGDLDPGTPG